ncbi:FecR family protein [Parabacteroides pacaensis]|uniref:FecR family protein n=1 Tax=Parabacteroides pacaensis TaxID=2086575 RepID=UPI000D103ADA|nr:FecR domain-containing protein [Parabacteroides pacaensis]
MDSKEDKYLDFVLRHYRQGKLDTQKAYRKFLNEHAVQVKISKPWRPYLFRVAAVLTGIILGIGLYNWLQASEEWIVCTSEQAVKEVWLPDSTLVTLAPGSSVRYEARAFKSRRDVEMQGKAFFQVKRDPQHPFSVQNDQAEVQVLGTEFQMAGQADTTEVWVQSGKVSFSSRKSKKGIILTRGMSAVLASQEGEPKRIEQASPNTIAWKTGFFVYDNTPLEIVLKELSDYYGIRLSATQTPKHLTGRFSVDNIDEILEIIESTLDIRIEKQH